MKVATRESVGEIARPILKWAGGKSQLYGEISKRIPNNFGKYIEPFAGGAAVFFELRPEQAIISDSNPELINLYRTIVTDVEAVIRSLKRHKNEKDHFYAERAKDWKKLTSVQAASRTLFLNKTCFNGLYRVNKKGQFNVPYGYYKNPKICDADNLRAASAMLRHAKIECLDYIKILQKFARSGDFVFLDPPYLPISEYGDFKRYTKEQFYEEDHIELAQEIERLSEIGCFTILTNSNHHIVHELYGKYSIDVFQTRRHISCNGKSRNGEDVIVTIKPKKKLYFQLVSSPLSKQVSLFPPTRFMGSKSKLLTSIRDVVRQFDCHSTLDLFSGSGVVSYMLKDEGKKVISNDYMALSAMFSKALIENNQHNLDLEVAELLTQPADSSDHFVQNTFKNLYFEDDENILIDNIRANIGFIKNTHQKAIAVSALIRACFKKRPRGIFTYVGHRYDDGRKDLQLSLKDHFLDAVNVINNAVFDNGEKNKSRRGDAMTVRYKPDLVYIDPPYYSPHSDNEYVRRYHFVEGIACNWQGVEMQWHTQN